MEIYFFPIFPILCTGRSAADLMQVVNFTGLMQVCLQVKISRQFDATWPLQLENKLPGLACRGCWQLAAGVLSSSRSKRWRERILISVWKLRSRLAATRTFLAVWSSNPTLEFINNELFLFRLRRGRRSWSQQLLGKRHLLWNGSGEGSAGCCNTKCSCNH